MNFSVKALYGWYHHTLRNPQYRWWLILGTLVYLISPIDIAPDLIPIAGQVDDFILLTFLVTEVSQMVLDFARGSKEDIAAASDPDVQTVDVDAVVVEDS